MTRHIAAALGLVPIGVTAMSAKTPTKGKLNLSDHKSNAEEKK